MDGCWTPEGGKLPYSTKTQSAKTAEDVGMHTELSSAGKKPPAPDPPSATPCSSLLSSSSSPGPRAHVSYLRCTRHPTHAMRFAMPVPECDVGDSHVCHRIPAGAGPPFADLPLPLPWPPLPSPCPPPQPPPSISLCHFSVSPSISFLASLVTGGWLVSACSQKWHF